MTRLRVPINRSGGVEVVRKTWASKLRDLLEGVEVIRLLKSYE